MSKNLNVTGTKVHVLNELNVLMHEKVDDG